MNKESKEFSFILFVIVSLIALCLAFSSPAWAQGVGWPVLPKAIQAVPEGLDGPGEVENNSPTEQTQNTDGGGVEDADDDDNDDDDDDEEIEDDDDDDDDDEEGKGKKKGHEIGKGHEDHGEGKGKGHDKHED